MGCVHVFLIEQPIFLWLLCVGRHLCVFTYKKGKDTRFVHSHFVQIQATLLGKKLGNLSGLESPSSGGSSFVEATNIDAEKERSRHSSHPYICLWYFPLISRQEHTVTALVTSGLAAGLFSSPLLPVPKHALAMFSTISLSRELFSRTKVIIIFIIIKRWLLSWDEGGRQNPSHQKWTYCSGFVCFCLSVCFCLQSVLSMW